MPSTGFQLVQGAIENPGFQIFKLAPAPAVATGLTFNLDPIYVWRLVSANFTLTCDANAANRIVTLEYQDDSGNTWEATVLTTAITANTTQPIRASTAPATSAVVLGTPAAMPVPRAFMQGGGKVFIRVTAIQAGDQLSACRFLFDVFPTSETEWRDIETG